MKRECETCIKRKTKYCPNSSECYEIMNKPYYQNKIMLLEENEQLMKAFKEKETWLSICILNLMEEYKTDTIWITSQQMESNKNKNICYEVYKNNDVKFYQKK